MAGSVPVRAHRAIPAAVFAPSPLVLARISSLAPKRVDLAGDADVLNRMPSVHLTGGWVGYAAHC